MSESDGKRLARMGTDAQKWAAEFMKLHGNKFSSDYEDNLGTWDLMVTWFANAIEVGRSAGQLPPFAAQRIAGRLSTEPPYSHQHPETLMPLACALLDVARWNDD